MVLLIPMREILAERLESLYRRYGPETSATDPILFPRRYEAPEDREVVGWIATAFAYGQVGTIQESVGRLLEPFGPRPARALGEVGDFRRFARERLRGFRHRFHGASDAAALLYAITCARGEAGSLRLFFERELREEDRDVGGLLSRVVAKIEAFDYRPVLDTRRIPEGSPVRFFFPSPVNGSACKRWNLYLRWMVRRDRLDFGLWPGIPTDRLVMPTDTHVHRIARRLGLTSRRTADWRTARQITDSLSRFDPRDPVRFDYSLCRIGILDICRPRPSLSLCHDCPVQDACSIGRRKRAKLMCHPEEPFDSAQGRLRDEAADHRPDHQRQTPSSRERWPQASGNETPGSRQRRAKRGVYPGLQGDCGSRAWDPSGLRPSG